LAVDEPEGDLNSGEERLDSPKTYLHVRPYPDRHVRSYADTSCLLHVAYWVEYGGEPQHLLAVQQLAISEGLARSVAPMRAR